MCLTDETEILEGEAKMLWTLQQSLSDIKRRFCRSGTGSNDIREELEDVIFMSKNPLIVERARRMIADIDRHWPPLVRYG